MNAAFAVDECVIETSTDQYCKSTRTDWKGRSLQETFKFYCVHPDLENRERPDLAWQERLPYRFVPRSILDFSSVANLFLPINNQDIFPVIADPNRRQKLNGWQDIESGFVSDIADGYFEWNFSAFFERISKITVNINFDGNPRSLVQLISGQGTIESTPLEKTHGHNSKSKDNEKRLSYAIRIAKSYSPPLYKWLFAAGLLFGLVAVICVIVPHWFWLPAYVIGLTLIGISCALASIPVIPNITSSARSSVIFWIGPLSVLSGSAFAVVPSARGVSILCPFKPFPSRSLFVKSVYIHANDSNAYVKRLSPGCFLIEIRRFVWNFSASHQTFLGGDYQANFFHLRGDFYSLLRRWGPLWAASISKTFRDSCGGEVAAVLQNIRDSEKFALSAPLHDELPLDTRLQNRNTSAVGKFQAVACNLKLGLNFFSLSVSGFLSEFKLLPRQPSLHCRNLAAGSNLTFAGLVKADSGQPKPDCRNGQDDSECGDDAFVVSFKESSDISYQRDKRAVENGTVFIAILAGAGAIWWWMACHKR